MVVFFAAQLSWGQGFFGSGGNRNNGASNLSLVGEATVSTRFRYITVGGRLNPARRLDHSVTLSGIVEKILHKEGERVSIGDPLVIISREAAGETYRPIQLESRISGIISKIYLTEKAEVKAGAIAATIIDDSNFSMAATVSDKDAFQLMMLHIEEVTAQSPDNEKISGTMLSLSAEPDYNTGLFTVTFQFPAQQGARIGMVLFVDLPVKKYEGIFVTQNALERRFGKNYLWIFDESNALKLTPVELGDVFGTQVEITKGLSVGNKFLQRLTGNEKEGTTLEQLSEPKQGRNQ